MSIQTKKLTVKIKDNPNNHVTVKTRENLGAGAISGDDQVGARFLGVEGPRGKTGLQGVKGDKGDKGDQGDLGIGINWRGDWDGATLYSNADAVHHGYSSYVFISETPAIGSEPPDTDYWDVMAEGGVGSANDAHYTHVQGVAASVWTINHGLNKYPSVMVVDSGDSVVEGDIQTVDLNTITVTFTAAFTGKAYIN